MDYELTADGLLARPSLGDGDVLGIQLCGKHGARVTVRDIGGQLYNLEFSGVQRLLCDGFAQGNIISAILITTRAEPYVHTVKRLLGELYPSVEEPYRTQHERWVGDLTRKVADGHLTLVEIAPSYGCEIFVLCEAVKINPVNA